MVTAFLYTIYLTNMGFQILNSCMVQFNDSSILGKIIHSSRRCFPVSCFAGAEVSTFAIRHLHGHQKRFSWGFHLGWGKGSPGSCQNPLAGFEVALRLSMLWEYEIEVKLEVFKQPKIQPIHQKKLLNYRLELIGVVMNVPCNSVILIDVLMNECTNKLSRMTCPEIYESTFQQDTTNLHFPPSGGY